MVILLFRGLISTSCSIIKFTLKYDAQIKKDDRVKCTFFIKGKQCVCTKNSISISAVRLDLRMNMDLISLFLSPNSLEYQIPVTNKIINTTMILAHRTLHSKMQF